MLCDGDMMSSDFQMRSRDIQAGGVPGFYQRDALSHDVLMRILVIF